MAKANKKSSAPQVAVAEAESETTWGAEPTPVTSVEPVQLTIADLQLLARIVDLASRRGAFHAAELSQVGEAFSKLSGFLAYVESAQPADAAAETEAPKA